MAERREREVEGSEQYSYQQQRRYPQTLDWHTESILVQESLQRQITKIEDRVQSIYDELHVKNGFDRRLVILELRVLSIVHIGKWIAGVIASLVILSLTFGASELWSTRDAVRKIQQQQQIGNPFTPSQPWSSPPRGDERTPR